MTTVNNSFAKNYETTTRRRKRHAVVVVWWGCILYMSHSFQDSILPQFLPLFFQSKGLDGATVGILSSIVPLSTFVAGPLWSLVLSRGGGTASNGSSSRRPSSSSSSSFGVLYLTTLVASLFQTSLCFTSHPVSIVIARILSGVMSAPTKPLLDAIVLDGLAAAADDNENKENYDNRILFGKIRLFGILGSGMGTRFGGYILDLDPPNDRTKRIVLSGYPLLFSVQAILVLPALACIWKFQRTIQKDWTKSDRDGTDGTNDGKQQQKIQQRRFFVQRQLAGNVWRDTDHCIFFATVFIMGISAGVNDAFTYVRFREVECTTSMMGTSRLLSSISGAVMFFFSGGLNEYLGMERSMIICILCGTFRLLLIMRMDHHWFGHIAEIIRGGIFGTFWSTCTVYASGIGPPNQKAIMLLLLNGAYNGIGRSTGALLGGKLQTIVGTKATFLYFSVVNLVLVAISTVYYFHFRARRRDEKAAMSSTRLVQREPKKTQ